MDGPLPPDPSALPDPFDCPAHQDDEKPDVGGGGKVMVQADIALPVQVPQVRSLSFNTSPPGNHLRTWREGGSGQGCSQKHSGWEGSLESLDKLYSDKGGTLWSPGGGRHVDPTINWMRLAPLSQQRGWNQSWPRP